MGAVKRGVESDSSLWTSKVRFFVGEWVFRLLVLTQVELNWRSRQGRDNATTMRRGPTLIAQLVPAFFLRTSSPDWLSFEQRETFNQ